MHVLLTGASSGIGEAMARYWGSRDTKLTLAARREEKLREIADQLSAETFVFRADLNELSVCTELVEGAIDALGPIDVLVNNAGIQYVEPAAGVSPERTTKIVNVDLVAPLHLMHAVLPEMMSRGSGTIVNVSSMAALTHTPGMAHYNAVKAGLAAASETMRVELAPSGVHVLTVYPGPVESPMEGAAREKYETSFAANIVPTGTPDVLAELVDRAIRKRKARIIYPTFYGVARYFRVFAQWLADRAAPPLAQIEE